ncbi:putative indole-3-acetic acid-amido synthetase GH3.1-like [Capsicum annuum]|nr:putative indole-3-acetic acid-amido synthetase GH3.1-like [Capsicum annuum]
MNRTKSRLMDSQEQDQRSGAVLKDSEVEEEDPFSDEDLPEEYKKVKFSTLTVLQLKVDKMTGAKVLPYVSSIWICLLVGAYIWLLKTRVVKVLAMSFHVSVLSTLDEKLPQPNYEDESAVQITSEKKAKAAAKKIFNNVAKPGSKLLGSIFNASRIIEKILVTAPERFEATITTLENTMDLSKITLAELLSAFQAQGQQHVMRHGGAIKGALPTKHHDDGRSMNKNKNKKYQPTYEEGAAHNNKNKIDGFKGNYPPYLRPTKVTKVRIGHGGYIPAKGMGTITIETQSGTKIISDVLYVPDLNQNLLSVGQLLEKGFKLYFKDKHCLIKEASRQDIFKVKMRGRSFSLNPLEEERGFHQLCVEPPLLKEDIPPDDKGWLCPGCDCKVDCIDLLNDLQGTDLSATDSREKYIPSSDESNFYSTSKDLTEAPPKDDGILGLSSEDSKDDDFNPDHPDKDESVKIESSSSDFTSDSKDFSLIVDTDRLGGDKQGVFSLLDNITPTSSSQEEKAKVGKGKRNKNEFSYLMQCLIPLVLAKRHVERLDYKKLNDETYGNESSDSSEKEYEGGPSP